VTLPPRKRGGFRAARGRKREPIEGVSAFSNRRVTDCRLPSHLYEAPILPARRAPSQGWPSRRKNNRMNQSLRQAQIFKRPGRGYRRAVPERDFPTRQRLGGSLALPELVITVTREAGPEPIRSRSGSEASRANSRAGPAHRADPASVWTAVPRKSRPRRLELLDRNALAFGFLALGKGQFQYAAMVPRPDLILADPLGQRQHTIE
jgi:hypothetical protein